MSHPSDERRSLPLAPDERPDACPFCGSDNAGLFEYVYAKEFAIACRACGAHGPRRAMPQEAVRLWNQRDSAA